MDEERERRERRMERGWDAGRRRVVNRERNETDGMRKGAREDGSVFADPLSAASAPDPASIPIPGSAHGFASTSGSIRPWMVWGRAAGGARQIRELHCQAGMIYLTNISI